MWRSEFVSVRVVFVYAHGYAILPSSNIHYKWRQGLPGRVEPTISWTHQLGDHGLSMGQVLALRPDPGLIRRQVRNTSRASGKGREHVVFESWICMRMMLCHTRAFE